jgi:hypothetical protein
LALVVHLKLIYGAKCCTRSIMVRCRNRDQADRDLDGHGDACARCPTADRAGLPQTDTGTCLPVCLPVTVCLSGYFGCATYRPPNGLPRPNVSAWAGFPVHILVFVCVVVASLKDGDVVPDLCDKYVRGRESMANPCVQDDYKLCVEHVPSTPVWPL